MSPAALITKLRQIVAWAFLRSTHLGRHLAGGSLELSGRTDQEVKSRGKLPDFIPNAFTVVRWPPLMPNGKVDRRALPAVDHERDGLDEETFVAPRNGTDSQLVRIWEETLGVRPIRITDNFFELGGHSILAVRLFARIKKVFGRELPLSILLEAPTIAGLSGLLDGEGESTRQ